jgi:glycosidase
LERFSTTIGGDIIKFKLAMAFFLTTRGIPEIYYGTELMMESNPCLGHGSYRMDYRAGWENDAINAFTGKELTHKQLDARDYLQKLLLWRKDIEVIHSGKLKHFLPDKNVFVYYRYNTNESVIVILNKNTGVAQLDLNRVAECSKNFTSETDILSGITAKLDGILELEPRNPFIIELK